MVLYTVYRTFQPACLKGPIRGERGREGVKGNTQPIEGKNGESLSFVGIHDYTHVPVPTKCRAYINAREHICWKHFCLRKRGDSTVDAFLSSSLFRIGH